MAVKQQRNSLRGLSRNSLRRLQALAGCLGALATSACAPVSEQYFREGVGVNLNSGQLSQATQLQDEYVYYICRQAGGFNEGTGASPSCAGTDWTTFTVAGMNDIDQRCDAYLDWLDAQRRDRTPVLAQIAAMGAATSGIMGVAGAGTQAIAIVATAFGLAGTSYANWNSRLLLDVDHSTVQAVVYSRQQQYRQSIYNISVPNRASAIYLLRQYLRLCMPITIETQINTTATLVAKGASEQVIKAPLVQAVAAQPLRAATPVTTRPNRGRQPVVSAPGWEKVSPGTTIDLGTAKLLQRSLCIANPDGKFNHQTALGLKIFLSVVRTGQPNETNWSDQRLPLDHNGRELRALLGYKCKPGAENYLESWLLSTESGRDILKEISGQTDVTNIEALRPRIKELRDQLQQQGKLSSDQKDFFSDQITPDFLSATSEAPKF